MKLRPLLIIFAFFIFSSAYGTISSVRVELFRGYKINTLTFSAETGKYQFSTEQGKIYKIKKNQELYFAPAGNRIAIYDDNGHIGTFRKINLRGLTRENSFQLNVVSPFLKPRYYEGDLEIMVYKNSLKLVNYISMDQYLAGVIEAEAGPNAPFEFYKSQAIISRTYLLEIIIREGMYTYQLGDDVNHQVYKGMCRTNPDIRLAVNQTRGLVIVDTTMQLITAAFHSNSGGYTANSEDVWLSSKSYLKATPDPYSLNQKNTSWSDTISKDAWMNYLMKKGIKVKPENIDTVLSFNQKERNKYIAINDDTISLRKIREDFGLRSAWFSFYPKGDSIIFKGNGYGHGVGLSQEGAMQMAREKHSFADIIHYYYKNVKVIPYDLLIQ